MRASEIIRREQWTPEQTAALESLLALGLTDAEIARRLRTTERRVYDKRIGMAAARRVGGDLVIFLPKAGVRIVSKYQASWNPFEHHMVAG